MPGLTVLILLLYPLALARLTRLVNADTLTDPVRVSVARRFGEGGMASYFLSCPWCVSIWLGFATAPVAVYLTDLPWHVVPFLALASSHLIGLAAQLDGDDVEIVVEDD